MIQHVKLEASGLTLAGAQGMTLPSRGNEPFGAPRNNLEGFPQRPTRRLTEEVEVHLLLLLFFHNLQQHAASLFSLQELLPMFVTVWGEIKCCGCCGAPCESSGLHGLGHGLGYARQLLEAAKAAAKGQRRTPSIQHSFF